MRRTVGGAGRGGGGVEPPIRVVGAWVAGAPPPELRDAAVCVWAYGAGGRRPPSVHRVIPTAGPSVGFVSRLDAMGRVVDPCPVLIGPVRTPRTFAPEVDLAMHAIELRPEWSRALLGVAPEEHVDEVRWLAEVDPALAATLADSVPPSPCDPRALLAGLVGEMCRRRAEARLDVAVRIAAGALRHLRGLPAGEGAEIRTAARRLGLSARHLRRCVVSATGDGPKQLLRIHRLNALVAELDRGRPPAWARLAVEHGYFDQSHLIREVRALTGVTPRRLHAERRDELEHPVRFVQSAAASHPRS